MKTALIRIELSEYFDQFRIRHGCYVIKERIEVESTGESYTYEYYNETIKNPIYGDVDGRRWRCMVPTDFGCPASWHRRNLADEQIIEETWLEERGDTEQVRYWGSKPVVEFKS